MQRALIDLGGRHVEQAFALAEDAKARYFRRDVAFLMHLPHRGPVSAEDRERLEKIRSRLPKGHVDPRILLADYEAQLEAAGGVPLTPADRLVDKLLTRRDVGRTLTEAGSRTLALSFYSMADRTLMYIVDPSTQTRVVTLDVGIDALEHIVNEFEAGQYGDAVGSPIDARQPWNADSRFAPFLALKEQIVPAIKPAIEAGDRVLISPHGLWHNLPLHVLLQPLAWEMGMRGGVCYVPGIRILQMLKRRSHGALRRRGCGVLAAPRRHDSRAAFKKAHDSIAYYLKESGESVFGAHAEKATASQLFQMLAELGAVHVIAHGTGDKGTDPMQSGLLVASSEGLTDFDQALTCRGVEGGFVSAADLLGGTVAAHHVTLQACSIGRTKAGRGDEFWGAARALLVAGAESVLAPLWDVELESSTRLLALFYHFWLHPECRLSKWAAFGMAQYLLANESGRPEYRHFFHWGAFRLIGC